MGSVLLYWVFEGLGYVRAAVSLVHYHATSNGCCSLSSRIPAAGREIVDLLLDIPWTLGVYRYRARNRCSVVLKF